VSLSIITHQKIILQRLQQGQSIKNRIRTGKTDFLKEMDFFKKGVAKGKDSCYTMHS
jgi:hypothetical protein